MTHRELFQAIMHYGDFDRMPNVYWTCWPETLERWREEGLPSVVDTHEYLGTEPMSAGVPVNTGLLPLFDEEVIEETEDYRIFRQNDGVVCKDWKHRSCIPQYVDFMLKGPADWPEYKRRLQPDVARLPEDLADVADRLNQGTRPVSINVSSMIGILRNWMGAESVSVATLMYPELLEDYVETVSDLVCWVIDQVAPKVRIDMGWGWEDICFRNGPLIKPDAFARYCVPGYRKIADRLRAHGCDLYAVDCDGMIDHLIPGWLDGGVNILFPVEIGAWDADPMALRRKYGRELRIYGGINKLALEKDKAAIDAEIERRRPLMSEGGFIPLPDHLITPGTPLENMSYYQERIRALRF